MTSLNKKGIAMPVIMGLILCLAVWVASLSWTMRNSRSRYQRVVKLKKAYFMSRSALQHFFLKIKTMQRHCPETVVALEKANKSEWDKLAGVFVEDIILPSNDGNIEDKYAYKIKDFSFESIDYEKARLTVQINAEGKFSNRKHGISRLLRISR